MAVVYRLVPLCLCRSILPDGDELAFKGGTMEERTFFGFLSLNETSSGDGYIGAVLVTDQNGVPAEFRCTYPVKPSVLHKPLYGETLEPYVGVELCAKPLVGALDHNLILLLVNARFLLEVRPSCNCPVIFIERVGEAIEVAPADAVTSPPKSRVVCPSGRFQPIYVSAHSNHAEDLSVSRPLVENTFSRLDLLEPFERIAAALEVLAQQDSRFV